MKRLILTASLLLAFVLPAMAMAKQPTSQHVRHYDALYHRAAGKFGARAPGRNIARWGTKRGPATDAQVVRSIGVLERMLAPPPPPSPAPVSATGYGVASAPVAAPAPVASSTSYSGGYSIPSSIVMCESGGNWSAVNPSSGAGGAYQILPSTWAAYGGTGAPQNASPAEQSAIAAKIYAGGAGRSQWSC